MEKMGGIKNFNIKTLEKRFNIKSVEIIPDLSLAEDVVTVNGSQFTVDQNTKKQEVFIPQQGAQ
jgi:hypothetical protein